MNKEEKNILLSLARAAISTVLENKKLQTEKTIMPDTLKQKLATFVTLTIHRDLRGCIGHLEPVQELYKDVIENARSAAFLDNRFLPVTAEELPIIKIEISIISPNKKFDYQSPDELLDYLEKNKPGVIFKKKHHSATFLPQVWEELPDAVHFLDHLALKAGLDADEWRGGAEIWTYTVENFAEI